MFKLLQIKPALSGLSLVNQKGRRLFRRACEAVLTAAQNQHEPQPHQRSVLPIVLVIVGVVVAVIIIMMIIVIVVVEVLTLVVIVRVVVLKYEEVVIIVV